MDLPSKNMYDTYKDDIWKELGPLDPDWFEALTAQTFTNEGNVSDQDDLFANQEESFKTPFDKTAVESQLFSTPKVFRHRGVVSSETEDEQSFTGEQEKETLPWTAAQSPYLFRMSKERVPGAKYGGFQPQCQDSFELLHTPQKTPVSHGKHISESLAAHIHPDMSWTSSLNTPPAVPSTLILSKTDESPCPASVSTEKNVVFVRKLFPSLSNTSGVLSPKNNDTPAVHQGVVSPEAGQNPESHDSPQSSLNQSGSVWKQKLPDAIEDGEIRRTVASVLDGAENVLSIFFTNSSSALRKVKTDRIKRKQIIPTKGNGCSSTDISSTNNAASSEQRAADQEPGRLPSPPPGKTGDIGITQWSPLSLSEIPPCTVDASPATRVENNISTEQLWNDSDSGRLVRPHMKLTDSGFTKKKRKFVYPVVISKPQVQGKETHFQKTDSSPGIPDSEQEVNVKPLGKAPDKADGCSIRKNEMQKLGNLENLPPSVQAKVQGLDMSQLCRDFAQDFSQMSDPCKLSKVAEDIPRNGFSPLACLSAMKRAKQKATQAGIHHDRDGVGNGQHVSTTNQNNSIIEGTISDSGFQSAVVDSTHMTASSFVLPSSEISGDQQWAGFKPDIHRTTPFTSSKGHGKADLDDILQEAETDAKPSSAIKERQTPGPESTSAQLPSSAKGTVDSINCIPLNGHTRGSLPEKTVSLPSVHASGFKTASHKGIRISSANLERAKRLFEETEVQGTLSDQPIKCASDTKDAMSTSHGSVKNPTTNSNQPLSSSEKNVDSSCQLTASQKADVTELCTLLEEADSQFEFTQFKTAKLKQQDNATSPQKVDKDLDPDFLSGIDFDDSFSSEAEKHLAATAKPDKSTPVLDGKTNCETSDVTSKSTGSSSAVKKENSPREDASSSSKHISDRAGRTEISKLENKNPLMLGMGFKTAGGNVVRVSKKCLSKARALFADLEENLVTSHKSPDKQSSEMDVKTQHKCSVDNHPGNFLHHKEDDSFTGCGNDTGARVQSICSDRQDTGIRDEDATKSLKNWMDTTTRQSGFQMASGKGIPISAKAMQEADAFFKDCDNMDSNAGMSVKHKKSIEAGPGSVSHKGDLPKCKNVQGMKGNLSEEPINEFENVNAGPAAHHTEVVQRNVDIHTFGFENTPALTNAASFRGNPSSTAKALSSFSCTASKNIGSTAVNELSNGGGFCTASGKKVSMSADALKKGERLLNEIHTLEDANKQLKGKGDASRTGYLTNQIPVSPPKNGGFQTASGKGMVISSAALKKAAILLSECDEIEDKIVKPTHSKMPPPRNSGFLAASGKPVALSAEALQKAKALFSDISFSADIPAVSHTRISDKQSNAENTEKIHCGFTTAGGAKVHVSQKNLLKAKNLLTEFDDGSISAKAMQEADAFFKDCDILHGNDGMPVKHKKSIAPMSGSGSEKKNLPKFKQDQRVTHISEVNRENMPHPDGVEIHKGVLKNTWDSTNAASSYVNSSLMTKPLSPLLCATSKNISSPAINELSKRGGFCTASGKKAFVSDDAMAKAKSLLNESATFEDTNKQPKQKEDTVPPQNGGFQTASGKGVAISSAALKKAKTLLNECGEVEDKIGVKPTHSKRPVPGPPPRNSGFLAASGKPAAFSSEALQKAKALFSDISFSAEIPAVSDTRISDKKQSNVDNTEKIHCGFTTAGGAEVHVSQKNLLKAKNLLTELDDGPISAKAMREADAFFKDCDILDGNDGMPVKHKKSIAPVSGSGSEKKNLPKFKQDQRVTNISEVNRENMLHPDDVGIHKGVLKNTLDSTSAASSYVNSFLMTKPLSPLVCATSKNISSPAINELSKRSGFCTASGKKVSVSDDAMAKAKSLLNESATFEDTNKQPKQKEDTVPPQNGGFQTASGKGVVISSAALKKAKTLLNECDEVEDKIGVKPTHSKMPVPGPPSRNSGFLAASGKPAAFSSEALQKAKALFSDISFSAEIPSVSDTRISDKKQSNADNTEKTNCGFTTAGGAKVHVSQKNLLKAKNLLKDDTMTKAESLLDESATFEDTNKQSKQKEDTVPPQNGGFQTASGKGVAISSAALKKAKTLLNECDEVEDKIGVKPTHSEMPPPRNSGFLAASGKQVAFSAEALHKARALFSDISFSAEIPAVSNTRISDKKQDDEKIHCGFTTAGGAKVHVAQKSLLKAKNLLTEFADGDCRDSNSSSRSPHNTHKIDPSRVKGVNRTCNLTTASDKDIPTKFSAPQVVTFLTPLQETDHENEAPQNPSAPGCLFIKDKAPTDAFKLKEGKITSAVVGRPGKEMSSVLDYEINETSSRSEGSKVKRPKESSVLNFQSLNLSGCTETQQEFFAQEALDCTKALLEDESLAGQSLSMTENVPKSSFRPVEEQKGTGKRSAEDPDMTGQPPLKRRLLEEFDRAGDGPKGSTLCPEKSSPNGVMRDRRVFKYSVSLHPNITEPHRNGKNYVETSLQKTTPTQYSTPGDGRSAPSKMPAFVPPFLKNAKTESRKNTVLKDNIRTPSAFVPPFKKQRTIVQESSSKPQEEEEDKHNHPFVTPFKNNTYVPPTEKTQSSTDVTGNKSKQHIETVALDDTTNDNQNLPVGCGSEDSAASRVEDTLSRSQDILQNVELARDMQDMRIRKKKRQTIRPLPGSLFLTKTSGVSRIPLKAAGNGKPPATYSQKQLYGRGVHRHVCEITSETAESFRFSLQQFIKQEAFIDGGGVQLADGGWLIPSKDGTAGKEEFHRALCDTPGVDPKLISEGWVYNHYRWIVWKQASMERSFPETMGSLCLTPEQVLLQLKYRYDVEVDHSRRPALRKIMEKDDTAAKTLVLCVCGVVSRGHSTNRQSFSDTKTPQDADAKVENPSAVVWLTDGWYAIKAQLDEPLTAMLRKGRVAVGGKLIIHGAQLVGSQDACSPLEAPESLMLKTCANSSRPARWDAKLGFHKDPRPFLLPVSCLYSSGGSVGCVDIIILRSYPIQWMERKPDGGVVFRSVRAEEKEARRYNSHKQKAMEILFAKVQAEFEKEDKGDNKPQRRRRTISRQGIASLQDGEELYEAVGDDPAYLEAHLSEQQLETLRTYRRSLMEKQQAELQDRYRQALENAEDGEGGCPKREVTPVWRLCIADSMDQPGSVYQLNLWRPSSDLQSLLKEGCRFKVYNLSTSDGKKHGGSCSTVQLTGTKKTQFQDLQTSQEWLSTRFQPRVSTHFVDLQNREFQSLCGEVDLTGYVISILDRQGFSPAFYLTDGKLNFVKVRCFSSFAQSGLEDLVKPRVLMALSNLQLRGQSMSPTPVVYAGDLTVFSTNPKEVHLQESLSQLRNLVQGQENFFPIAEETLSHLVESDGLRSVSSPALQPRTPAFTTVTSQQPVRSLGSFTPVSRKPPAADCSTEKDPSSLKKRRALDYLSRIPSPPPLPHLGSGASPCVNMTFNPPRRSGTPSTLKTVQTPARKPVTSPVEDEWVNDEELAMIDTQALRVGDLL